MMSSFVQTCSPLTTASDSSRGMQRELLAHDGGEERRDRRAAPRRAARAAGAAGRSACTRRMNSSTSWLRGTNATTKSSSPIFPTSSSRDCARSHGYWLWSTIARRCSGSSSGTASLQSRISS